MGKCQILSSYDTFVSLGKRKTGHSDLRKTQKGATSSFQSGDREGTSS